MVPDHDRVHEEDVEPSRKVESEYNPEQFEAMKQQKDIWEHGINL